MNVNGFTITFGPGGPTVTGGWGYAPPPPPVFYLVTVELDGARRNVPLLAEEIDVLRARAAQYDEQLQREREQAVRAYRLTPEDAITELVAIADVEGSDLAPATLVRRAKRHAHPDTGGSKELFQRVTELEQILRDAGMLR